MNLNSLFVERAAALVQANGIVGLLTPSGIAADKGASEFFRSITAPKSDDLFAESRTRLAALYDFENRGNPGGSYFPDVDSRFKFCAIIFGGDQRRFDAARCAFFLHSLAELNDPDRVLNLSAADFTRVNPNTGAAPIFKTRRDAELTTRIYAENPVLVRHEVDGKGRVIAEHKVWPVRYATMFHMTNDSDKFITRAELEKQGWKAAPLNRWTRASEGKREEAVPLYVGRMVNIYDHRASSVTVNEDNLHNAALSAGISDNEKGDPSLTPVPQYWVRAADAEIAGSPKWSLAYRDIARSTDYRTAIAAISPTVACGNTLPLLVPDEGAAARYAEFAPLLLANMSSYAFDFVVRQKAQSTHLNWYILEQLPVMAPERFERTMASLADTASESTGTSTGSVRTDVSSARAGMAPVRTDATETIADFIRAEVLALTYTAHDMAPFARDMGYVDAAGDVRPPFIWDPEDRAHRMARLDAIFMRLYGLSEDDASYVLSTFPIVKRQDEAAYGRFRTRDLILAYLRELVGRTLAHANAPG